MIVSSRLLVPHKIDAKCGNHFLQDFPLLIRPTASKRVSGQLPIVAIGTSFGFKIENGKQAAHCTSRSRAEASLKRLKTDVIVLLFQPRVDPSCRSKTSWE